MSGPETPQTLAAMTVHGLHVLTQLMFIRPEQTVVYHVGKLPDDASERSIDLKERYRMVEVEAREVEAIAWLASACAGKGECNLKELTITDDIVLYYAVGAER